METENPYQSPADIEDDQESLSEAEKIEREERRHFYMIAGPLNISILARGAWLVAEKFEVNSTAMQAGCITAAVVLSTAWELYFVFSWKKQNTREVRSRSKEMEE